MATLLVAQPSFLGVGLAYPLRLDQTLARPAISSGLQRVKDQMEITLKTRIGERPFLVRNGIPFGTRIPTIISEDVDEAADIIHFETRRALDLWVPSISVIDTQTVTDTRLGAIVSNVLFKVRATNREDNFVTPYRFVQVAD